MSKEYLFLESRGGYGDYGEFFNCKCPHCEERVILTPHDGEGNDNYMSVHRPASTNKGGCRFCNEVMVDTYGDEVRKDNADFRAIILKRGKGQFKNGCYTSKYVMQCIASDTYDLYQKKYKHTLTLAKF